MPITAQNALYERIAQGVFVLRPVSLANDLNETVIASRQMLVFDGISELHHGLTAPHPVIQASSPVIQPLGVRRTAKNRRI